MLKQQCIPRCIASRLYRDGYVFLPGWRPSDTTIAVGRRTGSVVDISALLSRNDIPIVQTLRPQRRTDAPKSRYSGVFGLHEFPLHSDLAHWVVPPHYVMLRCQEGSSTVVTRLLASSAIASVAGIPVLRGALARQRRGSRGGMPCMLSLLFRVGNMAGFRWDPLFLVPMNEAGKQVAAVMKDYTWAPSQTVSLTLEEVGDTLILDNWRFLHGRSKVPAGEQTRRLERIYLSEIY